MYIATKYNNMDLNKHIKDNYKSKYAFAKAFNLTPQLVNYWCSKEWDHLSWNTKQRIKKVTTIKK